MLFAKLITPQTILEITELNGGVRPANTTMDDNTFFVYGEYHADFIPEILSRADFRAKYKWQDITSDDNVVVRR